MLFKRLIVDSVFELLHQYLVKQLTDETTQALIWFTMSFFKQLLFKKPSVLYQADELFTLPSFFVEVLYLLIGRDRSEERACLVMLLSLYLHLPHDAIAGDYSYLPPLKNEDALSVMTRWETKELSSFGLSPQILQHYFQEFHSLQNTDVFSQFCLSLPLLLQHFDYSELFTALTKVNLLSSSHIVLDCKHQHRGTLHLIPLRSVHLAAAA